MKKISQERQILIWLQAGNSLTAMQALNMFNCWNLKGRIFDIRKKLHFEAIYNEITREYDKIETKMIKTNSGKWIAKYKIVQNG